MKEIGEYFRETRIANGVGMEEAAEDLNMSTSQIENIESGNVRAFKDVFSLKELVKEYAKYLGLEPEKVLDEFNDFMFEHTSKISLTDIIAAKNLKQQKDMEETKKIVSPYTKVPKKKINYVPFAIAFGIILFVFLLIYFVVKINGNDKNIDHELSGEREKMEVLYEYTY